MKFEYASWKSRLKLWKRQCEFFAFLWRQIYLGNMNTRQKRLDMLKKVKQYEEDGFISKRMRETLFWRIRKYNGVVLGE